MLRDWQQGKRGEEDTMRSMFLHPGVFAFENCSQAGPVMLHKSKKLAEHILKDGLITHSEPIFVMKPSDEAVA